MLLRTGNMCSVSQKISKLLPLAALLTIGAVSSQKPDVLIDAQVPEGPQTAISMLHTDLLAGVPGYFWGNVSTSDVEQGCRYLGISGVTGLSAEVVAGNQSYNEDLTVQAMEYCDVTNKSPSGVQALFTDQNGKSIAVFCGAELDLMNSSCAIYLLGAYITAQYDQLNSSAAASCPGCLTASECRCVDISRDWSCFPADAQVTVEGGHQLQISELRVGDKVQSVAADGSLFNDEVYFFGHRDNSAMGTFVALEVRLPDSPAATIHLSPRHFIPVGSTLKQSKPTYAKDVRIGDSLMLVNSYGGAAGTVTAKHYVTSKGLYNPYTKEGSIVVNGVLASAHSSFILDDIVPASMTHHLPAIYNALFRPLLWLHNLGAQPGIVERVVDFFNDRLPESGILERVTLTVFAPLPPSGSW